MHIRVTPSPKTSTSYSVKDSGGMLPLSGVRYANHSDVVSPTPEVNIANFGSQLSLVLCIAWHGLLPV